MEDLPNPKKDPSPSTIDTTTFTPNEFIYPDPKILEKIIPKNSILKASNNGNIKVKKDINGSIMNVIFVESPFILLHSFDLIKLIELGKCCCYCGEVLKMYDKGRLSTDGMMSSGASGNGKDSKEKEISDEKHSRYLNGLDCNDCNLRWCSKACKKSDFKHGFLNHLPTNKSMTNAINPVDNNDNGNNGREKLVLVYDQWLALKKFLIDSNLDIIYYTFLIIIELQHDKKLAEQYLNLKRINGDENELINFLKINSEGKKNDEEDDDIETIKNWFNLIIKCFKKIDLTFLEFLQYLTIFKLNNFNNSIYLIISNLLKGPTAVKYDNEDDDDDLGSNCLISSYLEGENNLERDNYEDVLIESISGHSIKVTKKLHTDSSSKQIPTKSSTNTGTSTSSITTTKKPIFTNKSNSNNDKYILKVLNLKEISSKDDVLKLNNKEQRKMSVSSSNISQILNNNSNSSTSKKQRSLSNTSSNGNTNGILGVPAGKQKRRTASFTSSGASFGEGIIKYNRDQIREMLTHLSFDGDDDDGCIEEVESDYDADKIEGGSGRRRKGSAFSGGCRDDSSFELDVPETFGSARRKSVRFDDNVSSI